MSAEAVRETIMRERAEQLASVDRVLRIKRMEQETGIDLTAHQWGQAMTCTSQQFDLLEKMFYWVADHR